ncbi:MAG: hypothetical protein ACJ71R_13620 [Nitrososphaeraceae archaeon]
MRKLVHASKTRKEEIRKIFRCICSNSEKKGISKDRANAYVASVERKQGIEPRTGTRTKKKTTTRRKSKK